MSKKILSDLDLGSAARLLNLLDPAAAQEPATKAYVDSLVEGLAWKDNARVATQANLNLSSPGATIDGVTMSSGDRVLVKAQTSQPENGLYLWNGAAVAMTRSADASTAAELENAVTTVDEGTNAGTSWRQSAVNFTLGSSNVVWGAFGTGAPSATETTAGIAEIATQAETDTGTDDTRFVTPLKAKTSAFASRGYSANLGDGSATSYALTHNLGTRNVIVQVYRNGTPWDTVECDAERTDANTVTLKFASAPTTNQYTALVHKLGA